MNLSKLTKLAAPESPERTRRTVTGRGLCPACGYELSELPKPVNQCPECGGELTDETYAAAAARRTARWDRLAIVAAPGFLIVASIVGLAISRNSGIGAGALMGLSWMATAALLYWLTRRLGKWRLSLAMLLGLPTSLGLLTLIARLWNRG